jgi:SAM-dependent methyltransferase
MKRSYRLLYRLQVTPWDDSQIPAAIVAAAGGWPGTPGVAVDLGCGNGGQARYLAARGWEVTGVDFIPEAIEAARRDDADAMVTWRVADVTQPSAVDPDGALAARVTLLLDNGCLHGIPERDRPGWARTADALAAPGCRLLVRAAGRGYGGIGPRGISPGDLTALLGNRWRPSPSPGPGWFLFTRASG